MNFISEGKLIISGYVHLFNNYEFHFRRQNLKLSGNVKLVYTLILGPKMIQHLKCCIECQVKLHKTNISGLYTSIGIIKSYRPTVYHHV